MEPNDIRTLKLLEKVDEKSPQSQRALARELNISVGLVNAYLKRLTKKGHIKILTTPTKRVKYTVTPAGLSEKKRLTYNFIQLSYQFYVQTCKKLKLLFDELEKLKVRKITFWGATDLAEMAYLCMNDSSIILVAIVDDRNIQKKIAGQEVRPLTQLSKITCDRILITDDRNREEVMQMISSYSIPQQKIVWLV